MDNFLYPWQRLLQDAIDETDLQEVPEKLAAAEGAMFLRWQQLTDSHNHYKESEALRQASGELLKLQTQRLKWPIPDGIVSGGSDCTE
ncbi:MAG: hypothetical protein WCD49_18750 [Candidatus Acidiferrales bacterium]